MTAHLSDRKRPLPSPGQQALVALLVASAVIVPAWSWTVSESPDPARPAVGLFGGVAALLLCVAVAVAVHQVAIARNAREHAARVGAGARLLEEEAGRVVDVLLPALSHAVSEGRAVHDVLGEHARPAHPAIDRLSHAVTTRIAGAERRSAEERDTAERIEEQVASLADLDLPLMLLRIRQDRPLAEETLSREFRRVDPVVERLRRRVLGELLAADRRRDTAMLSAADAGARLQAHLTTLLAQLRGLEERYGDRADVFTDLLEVDHNVSRTGRLADGLVVLAGGRSGRRWTRPIEMESILRGAMGRITAYRRVRLHHTGTTAVVGHAAEGVMQALAEVMDNAACFSAHDTDVHVYAQEEDTGVSITVEDSGPGIRHRERRHIESLLAEPRDLSTLPGSRTGLAVVGRLAAAYGLKVSLRPSARGGLGVVMLIPPALLTDVGPRPEAAPAEETFEDEDVGARTHEVAREMSGGGARLGAPAGARPGIEPQDEDIRPSMPWGNGTGLSRGRALAEEVWEHPDRLHPGSDPSPLGDHETAPPW
ncbi:sensor histidine kinase [Nocardiopsis alba]|uniref:sensor histidine kinase n=1 Tax=Nocardiopsis alba TaxID=53437 RepID=UPI003672D218